MALNKFVTLPAPEILKGVIECFRVFEHNGEEELAIKVSPNALPGIVFQHINDQGGFSYIG